MNQNDTKPAPAKTEPASSPSGKRGFLRLLGVLLLLLVIAGGAAFWTYRTYYKPLEDFQVNNITLAESSPRVVDTLGDAPTVDGDNPISLLREGNQVRYEYKIAGKDGEGKLILSGTQQEDGSWQRDELMLEFNGESVNLDPEEELTFSIEGLEDLEF